MTLCSNRLDHRGVETTRERRRPKDEQRISGLPKTCGSKRLWRTAACRSGRCAPLASCRHSVSIAPIVATQALHFSTARGSISTAAPAPAIAQAAPLKGVFKPVAPEPRVIRAASPAVSRARAMQMYAALPMAFEANQGQTDGRVKFLAHAPGHTLLLTRQEAVLSLPGSSKLKTSPRGKLPFPQSAAGGLNKPEPRRTAHNVRLKFVSASAPSAVNGRGPLPGKTNYFIGNDPNQWRTNVPNYPRSNTAAFIPA